jgi:hypothetical protein
MSAPARRAALIVRGVVAAALRDAAATAVIVLDDWTPEGELAYEWLVAVLGEDHVWRAASLDGKDAARAADDAQQVAAWHMMQERGALVAHPANKTALLLGGRLPWADLFPLGDLWASQVESIASRWSGPGDVEAVARDAGGIDALDAALIRLVDAREDLEHALSDLPPAVAQQLIMLYERGRFFRLRPRLVPKLAARTIGVDLFD